MLIDMAERRSVVVVVYGVRIRTMALFSNRDL
jgi:hypothetical protein